MPNKGLLPIARKLRETQAGRKVLADLLCPGCEGYESISRKRYYRCVLLAAERTAGVSDDYYPLVSRTPCMLSDARSCPISDLARLRKEKTR